MGASALEVPGQAAAAAVRGAREPNLTAGASDCRLSLTAADAISCNTLWHIYTTMRINITTEQWKELIHQPGFLLQPFSQLQTLRTLYMIII